jgi:hypothetical protein
VAEPTPPDHREWELLAALYGTGGAGGVVYLTEAHGSLGRCFLPADRTRGRLTAVPVLPRVAAAVVGRGWVARVTSRALPQRPGVRVTSYRLSRRGYCALRRLRPDLCSPGNRFDRPPKPPGEGDP